MGSSPLGEGSPEGKARMGSRMPIARPNTTLWWCPIHPLPALGCCQHAHPGVSVIKHLFRCAEVA